MEWIFIKRTTHFKKIIGVLTLLLLITHHSSLITVSHAERIKDIANFEGVRTNQVIGYGLVVGLDGTGDKGNATLQSVANMLKGSGISVKVNDIKAKNVAAVMVTSTLPPFPKPGVRIDALVSTIGDAKSLQGGTLLLTPLKGPDGNIYALGQGPVSIGGFIGGGAGTTVQKNHLTSGKVPEGVTIEKDPNFSLGNGKEIKIFLRKPDFATASEVTKKINEDLAGEYATTIDPSAVRLSIPDEYRVKLVELISRIEALAVSVDVPAKVVINERTGTVVIGDKVRIAPVAIAHGALTIEIKTDYKVTQPPASAPENSATVVVMQKASSAPETAATVVVPQRSSLDSETAPAVVVPQKEVRVKEQKSSLIEVSGVTLGEVVKGLNALGVTPRDLISILQALKAAGALRAELEII